MDRLFFEIVSGKPFGELYHRDVYVAFTEEDARDCEAHILDHYEEWELENWAYGPHVYRRHGDPEETLTWNGHEEVSAPIWQAGEV